MITREELKRLVLEQATEIAHQGAGWAQESMVLRQVAGALRPRIGADLKAQQAILSAWHELFFEKKLLWGYDIDNPNFPFFHIAVEEIPLIVTEFGEGGACERLAS